MKKKKIVENDKKKIESTILELDKKKKEHLSKAFTQVTKVLSWKRYFISKQSLKTQLSVLYLTIC